MVDEKHSKLNWMQHNDYKLYAKIRKRFLELDILKRKELDGLASTFGIDTKPYLNTMWYGANNRKENYSNITKSDVIFVIIEEELKREYMKNEQ